MILSGDLRALLIKYRIPLSSLGKEILVDTEFLEEFAERGDAVFPYAFPGFLFRYVGGVALERDAFIEPLRSEYPKIDVRPLGDLPAGERLFVETPADITRETIVSGVVKGYSEIYGVARERIVSSMVSEPGFPDYSAFSVLIQSFYDVVDAYRLPSDAFYPIPKGTMAGFVLKKRKDYPDVEGYHSFLQKVFTQRKKKLRSLGFDADARPYELEPEELLEIYETTRR